jgi:4-alpha-glucanotransferase
MAAAAPPRAVTDALAALGVRKLVVGIHDPAFPGLPGDDVGRGSPYSRGAERFLRFVRALGFDGVQLGPQGQTSAVNPSPYDGTIFARNVLSIDLRALTEPDGGEPLLREETLARLAADRPTAWPPGRVPYRHVFVAQRRALDEAFARFEAAQDPAMNQRLARFKQAHQSWLDRDGLYGVLLGLHGGQGFRDWRQGAKPHPYQDLWDPPPRQGVATELRRIDLMLEHHRQLDAFAFEQMLVHEQHAGLRQRCQEIGLALYGDLQIGLSDQDVFAYRKALLPDYLLGAPPSRTAPAGQAWNYPVLDPGQADRARPERSTALRLLLARVDKLYGEYDAIRIDHPHGLVCPWVYRANQPDPITAVQQGARLHAAPDLPDHPALAKYAIALPEQIDRSLPRYADDWERDLRPAQIDRYAMLFDAMVESARQHGREAHAIVCEVLSTLPRPLAAVLARHALGRFRVVTKTKLDDPSDVYRPENARPEDWMMAANHDTPPVWSIVETWRSSNRRERWAAHLGARLGTAAPALLAQPGALVHALFAEMFASAAENFQIFFTDLFGLLAPYNVPGTISDNNWSLRLGPGFERDYREEVARGQALSLPRALAMAMGGRGTEFRRAHAQLVAELERLAMNPGQTPA